MTLAEAQAAAERADRLFPLSLASEGSCTIGGNLSTNAGRRGRARLWQCARADDRRRGRAGGRAHRQRALQAAQGQHRLRPERTCSSAQRARSGIITAAALKLFARSARARDRLRRPRRSRPPRWLCSARRARLSGTGVVSFELIPRIALDFVLRHVAGARDPLARPHPWYVLVEIASQVAGGLDDAIAEWLAGAPERGLIDDAALAATRRPARRVLESAREPSRRCRSSRAARSSTT